MRMEGYLMKKGWFNTWKPRYVTCSEKRLSIQKKQGKGKDGSSFNLMDCHVKPIDEKRWNRKFVFRLKINGKRIYLAADDEPTFHKWLTALKRKVARASLLGANSILAAQTDKQGHSTMALLSKGDGGQIMSFSVDAFIASYDAAMTNSTDPEAQFKFAEVCGEFLALAHAQGQALFRNPTPGQVSGLSIRVIDKNERKQCLNRMRGVASLFKRKEKEIILPLQCVVDFGGRSLFIEMAIDGMSKDLTPEHKTKLNDLGLNNVDAFSDKNGRLWVTGGCPNEIRGGDVNEFVQSLDRMDILAFDSQSLGDSMKSHGIPVRALPKMAESTSIPTIRSLIHTEMVARVCKELISARLSEVQSTEWTSEICKFFDLILGNNDEFWTTKIAPAIKKKFGVDIGRDLYMPQLFFSLQFHVGADFKDTSEYNFGKAHAISLENLNAIHAVPHHFFVEICASLRNINEDSYKLLTNGLYSEASAAYNNKVSMCQSIYGGGNIKVASCLSQLSQAYVYLGDTEKASLCAKGAVGAGRHFHAALVPAYMTFIATCPQANIDSYAKEALEIVRFQLGDSHWFAANVDMAAASAHESFGNLEAAAKYADEAGNVLQKLFDPNHPEIARCFLLQGKIKRAMKQYDIAQTLIEKALHAFGDDNIHTADCQYELAYVLLDSGRAKEAESPAVKALDIRKANLDADDAIVISSVQQLAEIYDNLGEADRAFDNYRILLNYLKSLEDESVFSDVVKVIRNVICLFFRTVVASEKEVVSQIKEQAVDQAGMKVIFQQLLDNDPVDEMKKHFKGDIHALACVYHLALDPLSSLSWLDEH